MAAWLVLAGSETFLRSEIFRVWGPFLLTGRHGSDDATLVAIMPQEEVVVAIDRIKPFRVAREKDPFTEVTQPQLLWVRHSLWGCRWKCTWLEGDRWAKVADDSNSTQGRKYQARIRSSVIGA